MLLKLKEVDPLYKSLAALDGDPPFKFSQKVTWNKARNIDKLLKLLDHINGERAKIIKSISPDGTVPTERQGEFWLQYNTLLEEEVEITLLQLDPAGLNLYDETNPNGNVIPASVLGGVMLLIPEDTPCPAPI